MYCTYFIFISFKAVSTVANVGNNELRIENNAISGYIFLTIFSIRVALFSNLFSLQDRRECFKQFKNISVCPANGGEWRIIRHEGGAN